MTSARRGATMKVTGTGNPASLRLRLREREVAGFKEELGHRAAVADDAATSPSGQSVESDGHPGPDDILAAATAMLDQLAATEVNEQGRVVVSGPTWLLAPAIRGATAEAAEQLVSVLRRFCAGRRRRARGASRCDRRRVGLERDADGLRARTEARAPGLIRLQPALARVSDRTLARCRRGRATGFRGRGRRRRDPRARRTDSALGHRARSAPPPRASTPRGRRTT
jgi:hypothetical protein